jgi:hypothetical protein
MVPMRVSEYPLDVDAGTLVRHCEDMHQHVVDMVMGISEESLVLILGQVNQMTIL